MTPSHFAAAIAAFAGLALAAPAAAQDKPAADAAPPGTLAAFVGEWEGEATHLPSRDPARGPITEKVTASCAQTLKDRQVLCRTAWVQAGGRVREMVIGFNLQPKTGRLETLHLYDGPYTKVLGVFGYDDKQKAFVGLTTFAGSDGIAGVERIEWRLAAGGASISGSEQNHLITDPPGYWARTFEFTWRRK